MKTILIKTPILALCLITALLAVGCASTKVSDRQQLVTETLPRPGQIWVYDFVASASDVPSDSVLAGEADVDNTSQTPEQIAEGRKLGAAIGG